MSFKLLCLIFSRIYDEEPLHSLLPLFCGIRRARSW